MTEGSKAKLKRRTLTGSKHTSSIVAGAARVMHKSVSRIMGENKAAII
jgi:hypothetical protein